MLPVIEGVIFDYGVGNSCGYIEGALYVHTDVRVLRFSSDFAAAIEAEKFGVKFIDDVPFLPVHIFVDTPDNRAVILRALEDNWVRSDMLDCWASVAFDMDGMLRTLL